MLTRTIKIKRTGEGPNDIEATVAAADETGRILYVSTVQGVPLEDLPPLMSLELPVVADKPVGPEGDQAGADPLADDD